MKTDYRPLELYIHIPFCVRKCLYCDFLSFACSREQQEEYLSALLTEIKSAAPELSGYEVRSIFFGGGTPSLVDAAWIERILEAIRADYRIFGEAEISLEANPGTLTGRKLSAYGRMGINRLSIGLQSASDKELEALGRIHSAEEFFRNYEEAVKSGFNNINVDLMTGIPGQTVSSYKATLQTLMDLQARPAHISAYSLIIEEGTPFYHKVADLPDEDTERELYKITNDILSSFGYHRYEISNYARPGHECYHNIGYWRRRDYRGFGIGAATLLDNCRFRNTEDMRHYIQSMQEAKDGGSLREDGGRIRQSFEKLTKKEQMEEFMFLGLRMMQGVSSGEFERLFGCSLMECYGEVIDKHRKNGLLRLIPGSREDRDLPECSGEERLVLTERGIDVSNMVMADFLLDE